MGHEVRPPRHRCFTLPKQGHAPDEFEDAFACDSVATRFAVADGASESIYAGEWARALCETFVKDPPAGEKAVAWLAPAQRRWRHEVRDKPAPWHVEEKLCDGAFATFLGVVFGSQTEDGRRWRAIAVGDTCLFVVSGGSLRLAFPLEKSAAFDTRPDLIGSRQRGELRAATVRGTLAAGDQLLLMTDALAQWFLACHENGRKPWRDVERLTEGGFTERVSALRAAGALKNDDVTLVVIDPPT